MITNIEKYMAQFHTSESLLPEGQVEQNDHLEKAKSVLDRCKSLLKGRMEGLEAGLQDLWDEEIIEEIEKDIVDLKNLIKDVDEVIAD